jgi:hypothetical protein
MENLLFYQLFLLLRQPHIVHLLSELIPGFFSFSFFVLGFSILILDVGFGTFCFLFCSAGRLLNSLFVEVLLCCSMSRRVAQRFLNRRLLFPRHLVRRVIKSYIESFWTLRVYEGGCC